MINHLIAFIAGFALDILCGDPWNGFHIVIGIGKLISALEKHLRRWFSKTERGEMIAGTVLVVLVCALSLSASSVVLMFAYGLHPVVGIIADTFLCWQCLAATSLKKESMNVYRCLEANDLPAARLAVGRIVGRDTCALDVSGIIRACVETVAENTCDGVIAPMFYLALGGAPLGVFYKAVNTMDSMLGYQNERYLFFGRAAAKTDDAVNFIPARVSGLLMVLAAALCRLDSSNAFRIFRRDRLKHASPNSGQTESACAGALHIQLGGNACFFGKAVEKPTIADADRPVQSEDIRRVNRLMLCSYVMFFLLCAAARGCLLLC